MGWGGREGQEHQGREVEAELPSLWALVSKSVGQEPEEAWRPQLPGGDVCLLPLGQTAQTPGLADKPQSTALTVILSHPLPHVTTPASPGPFFSPPAGDAEVGRQLGSWAFALRLSPTEGLPCCTAACLLIEAWRPAKHHQLWEE